MPLQLPLAVNLREDLTLENFNACGNEFIVKLLTDLIEKKITREPLLYIVGVDGMGRSHLLQAACRRACDNGDQAIYLPMKELSDYSPEIFDNLEQSFIICLDDIEAIIGNVTWERAFFEFYNRCYDSGAILLVSSSQPYNNLSFVLPDLKSRMASGIFYQLRDLPDDAKLEVFKLKASQRGLMINDDVIKFLLNQYSRSLDKLVTVLDMLDQASLVEKHKITLPFVKKIIAVEA